MKRLAGVLLAIAVVGCSAPSATAKGIVVDVRSTSVTAIESFRLRTVDGRELEFLVGSLELDGGAFPAGHLREHMALAEPIEVSYRQENGASIAYRLTDATPSQQP